MKFGAAALSIILLQSLASPSEASWKKREPQWVKSPPTERYCNSLANKTGGDLSHPLAQKALDCRMAWLYQGLQTSASVKQNRRKLVEEWKTKSPPLYTDCDSLKRAGEPSWLINECKKAVDSYVIMLRNKIAKGSQSIEDCEYLRLRRGTPSEFISCRTSFRAKFLNRKNFDAEGLDAIKNKSRERSERLSRDEGAESRRRWNKYLCSANGENCEKLTKKEQKEIRHNNLQYSEMKRRHDLEYKKKMEALKRKILVEWRKERERINAARLSSQRAKEKNQEARDFFLTLLRAAAAGLSNYAQVKSAMERRVNYSTRRGGGTNRLPSKYTYGNERCPRHAKSCR